MHLIPTTEILVFVTLFKVIMAIVGLVLILKKNREVGLPIYAGGIISLILVTIVAKGIAKTDGTFIVSMIIVFCLFLGYKFFLCSKVQHQEEKIAAA